jgi:hypothetical protein
MMRILGAVAVLILLTSGCSDDPGVEADPTLEVTTSPAPEATTTTAVPEDSSALVVRPGSIGPVSVGISKEDAVATGLFDADVEGVEGCTFELRWKKQFEGVDVLTGSDGGIVSLGVTAGGPQTSAGVGVGSTLAEVKAAYPKLSPVAGAGFDQAGAFHTLGDDHIGFLFGDATVATIKPTSKVSFMEVTSGDLPELMRSGC